MVWFWLEQRLEESLFVIFGQCSSRLAHGTKIPGMFYKTKNFAQIYLGNQASLRISSCSQSLEDNSAN